MIQLSKYFTGGETVYLAGPMTGIAEKNQPLFNLVHGHIKPVVAKVYNPTHLPKTLEWHEAMRQDIQDITKCTDILFLPNWWESKGANIEHWIGQIIRCRVAYLTLDLVWVHTCPILL